MASLRGGGRNELLLAVYPVGSIYISVNSANPETLFGGIWEQLKDRFLLGAGSTYSNGSTGGAATHTLTTAEMPSHTHTFTGSAVTSGTVSANHTHSIPALSGTATSAGGHFHYVGASDNSNTVMGPSDTGQGSTKWCTLKNNGWNSSGPPLTANSAGAHTHSVTTNASTTGTISANHSHSVTAAGSNSNAGSGNTHNNMPPYLTVYMWKRTA